MYRTCKEAPEWPSYLLFHLDLLLVLLLSVDGHDVKILVQVNKVRPHLKLMTYRQILMKMSELTNFSHLLLHALDGNRVSERAGDVVGAKGVGSLLRELWTEGSERNDQRTSFKFGFPSTNVHE